jgi:hypothetical protein
MSLTRLLCCVLLASCGDGALELTTPFETNEGAILGGVPAPDYPEGATVSFDGKSCSAALIHPRAVLTASHCACGEPARTTVNLPALGQGASVVQIYRHGNQPCREGGSIDARQRDLALMILDHPIQLPSYPSLGVASKGQTIRHLGQIGGGGGALLIGPSTRAGEGIDLAYPDGRVSSDPRYFCTDWITQCGDSGGPVVLAGSHQIIGVNSFNAATSAPPPGGECQFSYRWSCGARLDVGWITERLPSDTPPLPSDGGPTDGGPSSGCDPVTQPAPHYAERNGVCLPSCGVLQGTLQPTPCVDPLVPKPVYEEGYCCVPPGSPSSTSSACDATTQPAPHWGTRDGECLRSCGSIGGTAVFEDPCWVHGMTDAGRSYETGYCCRAACDPTSQPAPHWGERNGECLPSCGSLGGTASFDDACANHGLMDAGRAYDVSFCCKATPPSCTPRGCPSGSCGWQSDGCSGQIWCGGCGATCGSMGGDYCSTSTSCPAGYDALGSSSECAQCCRQGLSCGASGGNHCSQDGGCPSGYESLGRTYECNLCCRGCTPHGCPSGSCGWQSDGCGGDIWCGQCLASCGEMGGEYCSQSNGCPGNYPEALGRSWDCAQCCARGPSCGEAGGSWCSQDGSCPDGRGSLGRTWDCDPCCD